MKFEIRAIGFDFDGTLIMSEEQKAKQMAVVFKEKFKIQKGVETAYKKLSGKALSREEKVKALFKLFLKRKSTKKELNLVKGHFGKHYQQSLQTCPLLQCTNIVKELKKQVDFIFLLSLEDKKEVKKVADHCGLGKYFDEILGGPKPKVENLKHILKKHKLKPHQVLYIGDAHSDIVASKEVKVKTILLGKKHRYEKLKEDLEADFRFSNLCDVPFGVEKLNSR
ncbi:MAG: HAD hydrolase-like protein [Nanoarchaeota archaeon]